MNFLWPTWLWAAAAVAVPVAIHLLSRGRGPTVSIGSIRFLPTTHSHRLRKIRPSGLLRFLVRACMLAALAVALAGPRLWIPVPAAHGESWVLVDPALLAERSRLEATAPETYRRLDTSTATERRLLAAGLPRWNGEPIDDAEANDLWSLVAEADRLAPPGAAIEVFALDRAESFRGARPVLGRPVAWRSVTDPEVNRWIQRAVRTDDGLDLTIGMSHAEGTRFSRRAQGSLSTAEVALEPSEDGDRLRLTDGGSRPDDDLTQVRQHRPPLLISIDAAEGRSAEANEVRRAATAVAAHLGRPLALATEPDESVDLAIGLGAQARGVSSAVRVLDGDAGVPCRQSVYVPTLPEPWLRLDRCGEPEPGAAHWRGGWGQPLLSAEPSASEMTWRWHSRFDPTWSSLTEAGLPHLLLDLIAPDDQEVNGASDGGSDRRAQIAGHAWPASADRPVPVAPHPLPERIAWALVVILLVTDRLLVGRRS